MILFVKAITIAFRPNFAPVYAKDAIRATEEEQAAWKAKAAPVEAEIAALRKAMKANKTGEGLTELTKKLEDAEDRMPAPLPSIFTVFDDPANKSPVHLLARGDYQAKGDSVGMRPLGILLPPDAPELPEGTKAPRAELAKWVTDPENPLTARVMVNRIWEGHFGRGIVGTPNDFGRMGERPTHPELLDYLANEFVSGGFSVKKIHRLILLSNTYQQSSDVSEVAKEKDPDGRLLERFPRRRLNAEEIRDSMLKVSGLLNSKTGGTPVMVPIDKGLVDALYKPAQWVPAKDKSEYNRRSIYLIAKRNLPLPFMQVFDSPDMQVSCPRRESSTHAPQALEMLNGTIANEQAKAFAERLAREAGSDPRRQIDLAYKLVAGRAPKPNEMQIAQQYLKGQGSREQFALAMFNLNSFLYVK